MDFFQCLGSCFYPPNIKIPDTAFEVSFGSYHPGGCMMSLADGSTRFITDSIDLNVWRGLASRAGGEVPGEY